MVSLGRKLREVNVAALSPGQKLELNRRELTQLVRINRDTAWHDFVRRWKRANS